MSRVVGCGNPSPEYGDDRRRIVLVVEDDVLIRTSFAEFLRGAGYTVVEAETAADAIAVFAAEVTVDAVFTDVRLTGRMDGFELAQWIAERHGDIPVLLTSGAAAAADDRRMSPERFVPKPYIYAIVERRLRKLIEDRRAAQGPG